MKIITKRHPCKKSGKEITINFAEEELVPNDGDPKDLPEVVSNGEITKYATEVSAHNDRAKRIKASFMQDGQDGTIDLRYLA